MATFYVDSTRPDDTGNGTSAATAKKTLGAALALVTTGAGDTVLLARGGTYDNLGGDSDISKNAVTFNAYGTGAKPIWTAVGTKRVMWTGNNTGLVFKNIVFQSPTNSGYPAVLWQTSSAVAVGPLFEDCDFYGDDGAFTASFTTTCPNFTFRRCTFRQARAISYTYGKSGCVFIYSANNATAAFSLDDWLIEDCNFDNFLGTSGLYIRAGSQDGDNVGKWKRLTVQRNSASYGDKTGGVGITLNCLPNTGSTTTDALYKSNYMFDGLRFLNNTCKYNLGGAGASIGPAIDTSQQSICRGNTILFNSTLGGTTGGLQINGWQGGLVELNTSYGNSTTGLFDGCQIFLDIRGGPDPWQYTAGCVGVVVRRNTVGAALGFGGGTYAQWLATVNNNPDNMNMPSAGIRAYYAIGNYIYGNFVFKCGGGISTDRGIDNYIYNNTIQDCAMGFSDSIGGNNMVNEYANNLLIRCEYDFYRTSQGLWDAFVDNTAAITLSASTGNNVTATGTNQFSLLPGIANTSTTRLYTIREKGDTDGSKGVAYLVKYTNASSAIVNIIRPFTGGTTLAIGAVSIGNREDLLDIKKYTNARFGGGKVYGMLGGSTDITAPTKIFPPASTVPGIPTIPPADSNIAKVGRYNPRCTVLMNGAANNPPDCGAYVLTAK